MDNIVKRFKEENFGKRAPNFTIEEEQMLLHLVLKYKTIFENKRIDTFTTKQKHTAWIAISNAFNKSARTGRDAATLRRKYENIKKRSKGRYAQEKRRNIVTGGDRFMPNMTLLGMQVNGNTSEFDIDEQDDGHIHEDPMEYTPIVVQQPSSAPLTIRTHDNTITDIPESTVLPTSSCTAIPMPLHAPKETFSYEKFLEGKQQSRAIKKKWSQVADAKLKLLQLQLAAIESDMQIKKEEHDLKIKYLKEEHDIKIKILEKELEGKERLLKLS